MTTQENLARPPSIAEWLINLFATGTESEPLVGDMLEEFLHLASESGIAFARRWYWRQTWKTVTHLVGKAYRTAPWSMAVTVIGGLLLDRLVTGRPERAIFAFLFKYQVFDLHSNAYVLFATIGHVLASLFIGCVVALAAKRREMAATVTLAALLCTMTGAAAVAWVANGQTSILWMLPWYIADWFAILTGGVIVRMRRASASHLHSAT